MEQPVHDLRAGSSTVTQAAPQRLASLVIVGLIHAGIIYAIVVGLASQFREKGPEELKVNVEKEHIPPKTPPPPPPDLAKPPPPFVPPPDINIQQDVPVTNTITTQSKVVTPPPVVQPALTPPRPIHPKSCDAGYPDISKRLGEEGKVLVQFTIAADGTVVNAAVQGTSGHDRLDQAAVECISRWRWKPAEQNGQPTAATSQLYIQYKLTGH